MNLIRLQIRNVSSLSCYYFLFVGTLERHPLDFYKRSLPPTVHIRCLSSTLNHFANNEASQLSYTPIVTVIQVRMARWKSIIIPARACMYFDTPYVVIFISFQQSLIIYCSDFPLDRSTYMVRTHSKLNNSDCFRQDTHSTEALTRFFQMLMLRKLSS